MKKLKILTSTLILILLIGIATIVRAESMEYDVSPKTGTLEEGKEIEITISISDIDMGQDGIFTFGGKLDYDENIFEKVTSESFTMKNNWSMVYNDEETGEKGTFLATNTAGTKQNQEMGTLKLKVKTNLKSTTTEVKFTQVSSVGEDTYNLEDSVVTLTIEGTVREEPEDPNNNEDPNNPNNPGNTENPDDPNNPNNPGNTENPDDPNNPNNPGNTENPDDPNDPNNPGNTGNQDDPNNNEDPTSNPNNNGTNNNGTNNKNPNGDDANKQNSDGTHTSQTSTSQKDTTISSIKLPYTGKTGAIVIGTILVLAIVAIVSYIQVKRHRNI